MSQGPSLSASQRRALACSGVTGVAMVLLRPVFRWRPETTFLGGFVGAILFFFLLIALGNFQETRGHMELGWLAIAVCEFGALILSVAVHPVCVTTCLLFSIPVVIYVKWAATQIKRGHAYAPRDADARAGARREQPPAKKEGPPAKKESPPAANPPRAAGKRSPRKNQ
jgi:hypothetical protein